MSRLADIVAQAKRERDPHRLSDAIPYARFMGMTFAAVEGDEIVATMSSSETRIGDSTVPALHGGTIGALLETTAIFQLLWSAESAVLPKTINITVEYLRPAQPLDTFARAIITRRGRRVASVRVEAWQSAPEQIVAMAFAHFLIQPDRDP